MTGFRTVLVGKQSKLVSSIKDMLKPLGYLIVGRASDGNSAVKIISATQPDLVIIDADMEFLEAAKTIDEGLLASMLLLVDIDFWHICGSVIEQWGFDYMEKPVSLERLNMALSITAEKYDMRTRENAARAKLKSAATTRNMVNRARDMMVKSLGLTETQALNRILVLSHQNKVPVRDMARKIIREVVPGGLNYQLKDII